jgi:hypothetical protein
MGEFNSYLLFALAPTTRIQIRRRLLQRAALYQVELCEAYFMGVASSDKATRKFVLALIVFIVRIENPSLQNPRLEFDQWRLIGVAAC